MSIDRRLRQSLQASGEAIRPDTDDALVRVVRRAGRRRHRVGAARIALAAVVTVLVLAIPLAIVHTRHRTESVAAVAPLVGTYVVDVPDSELANATRMTGRWVVELRPDGSALLTPPPAFPHEASGVSYRVDGDQLRTDAFVTGLCQTSVTNQPLGTYRWQRSGTTVALTVVSDTCEARRLLFAENWEVVP